MASVRDRIIHEKRSPPPTRDKLLEVAGTNVCIDIPLDALLENLDRLSDDRTQAEGSIRADVVSILCMLPHYRHDAINLLEETGFGIDQSHTMNNWDIIKIVLSATRMEEARAQSS